MKIQNSLGYLLNLSARQMKRKLDNQLKQYNVTTSQWAIMKVLNDCGELTQIEIAEKLKSDQATGGAVIDRMIKHELVVKRVHESDRRSYKVSLTEKGKEMIGVLEKMASEINEQALKNIDAIELKHFYMVLQQIIENTKEG